MNRHLMIIVLNKSRSNAALGLQPHDSPGIFGIGWQTLDRKLKP